MNDDIKTSAAMLEEARDPNNRERREGLCRRYEQTILGWCQRRGLQYADAEDVTQNVLLILLKKIGTFVYDPERGRFRDWLYTITRNACLTFLERDESRKYRPMLDDPPARDDLEKALMEQARIETLHAAMAEVSKRVSPRDWEIFDGITFKRRNGDELAKELGMTRAAVFKAASRVRAQVKAQLREFGGSDTDVEPADGELPG